MCESLLIETITGAIDLSVAFRFLKPVNVRKVESCLLIEDELSLDRGLADFVWVSRAFCKVIFYDVRYSSRHSFNWMCFCEEFVSCCQSLQRVYARNITAKSTCRLAYECGALSSLNGTTSSFFGKYPSLPSALLVKWLQSSHLYHLTILNGGEVTTLLALLAANNGNAPLETPVNDDPRSVNKQSKYSKLNWKAISPVSSLKASQTLQKEKQRTIESTI